MKWLLSLLLVVGCDVNEVDRSELDALAKFVCKGNVIRQQCFSAGCSYVCDGRKFTLGRHAGHVR